MTTATHTWMVDGIALNVVCVNGEIYLPTDVIGESAPKSTYEVADYDGEGNEIWTILVDGVVSKSTLVAL